MVFLGTSQKGVFIQFDYCHCVAKHSIKVMTYETCVVWPWLFFCFLFSSPSPSSFLLLLLCHLTTRRKPGLMISWHILCSVKNVSCQPVRKLFLRLASPSCTSRHSSPLQAGRGLAVFCRPMIRDAGPCGEQHVAPAPRPLTLLCAHVRSALDCGIRRSRKSPFRTFQSFLCS